jgi:hypothetical protein
MELRTRPARVVGIVVACLFGAVGALAVFGVNLLMAPTPATDRGRATRLGGLTAMGIGLVAGLAGGVWGVQRGLEYPPTVYVAFIEGSLLVGVPGLVFGALVGTLVALVSVRRAPASSAS